MFLNSTLSALLYLPWHAGMSTTPNRDSSHEVATPELQPAVKHAGIFFMPCYELLEVALILVLALHARVHAAVGDGDGRHHVTQDLRDGDVHPRVLDHPVAGYDVGVVLLEGAVAALALLRFLRGHAHERGLWVLR